LENASKKSHFARKTLLYLGSGPDISPVLSSQIFPSGQEEQAPVIILCDPGDNAFSFYSRLAEVRVLDSAEYLKMRRGKGYETDHPAFTLQLIQQPHPFTRQECDFVGLPHRDEHPANEGTDAETTAWDWMEIEVNIQGGAARRYRFVRHPHHVALKLIQYWRMELESLVIIRLPSLFDEEGNEMSIGDWVDRNSNWLKDVSCTWTDNPGPWTKRGWIPTLRMLHPIPPDERTSADRPIWCLNAPAENVMPLADDMMMHGVFEPSFGYPEVRSLAKPNWSLRDKERSFKDNHWADPGKWLFVTNSPEKFYKGSQSTHKLIAELPEGIDYMIDTQTMNSRLYQVIGGHELKRMSTDEQKSIYTLIGLLQAGHRVAVRVRDLDDAVDVIEQAYRLERIPSPGRAAIVAKLREPLP
jgi:hypothetical protein